MSAKQTWVRARFPGPFDPIQKKALREMSRAKLEGVHALHVASALGENFDILQRDGLDSHGNTIADRPTSNGCTPLMLAVLHPPLACRTATHLLTLGADPRRVMASGFNALHFAASTCDNPALLAILMGAGVCPFSFAPSSGHHALGLRSVASPLQLAARRGRKENVFYMLGFARPGDGHIVTAHLAACEAGQTALGGLLRRKYGDFLSAPDVPPAFNADLRIGRG